MILQNEGRKFLNEKPSKIRLKNFVQGFISERKKPNKYYLDLPS